MMAVAAGNVAAQVAGSTTIGVSPDEVKTLARGWSAKKQILGKPVYNDQDERVGEVEETSSSRLTSPSPAPSSASGVASAWARTTWRSP